MSTRNSSGSGAAGLTRGLGEPLDGRLDAELSEGSRTEREARRRQSVRRTVEIVSDNVAELESFGWTATHHTAGVARPTPAPPRAKVDDNPADRRAARRSDVRGGERHW